MILPVLAEGAVEKDMLYIKKNNAVNSRKSASQDRFSIAILAPLFC